MEDLAWAIVICTFLWCAKDIIIVVLDNRKP